MVRLLAKANDDVISHCKCDATLASLPGQLDCPWCGCGWLICCTHCRRAFTYARVVETDTDYRSFVREDRRRGGYKDDDPADLDAWALWLEEALADFEIGRPVVYLDGYYLDLEAPPGDVEGIFAKHSFERLPHLEALSHAERLGEALGEKSYWLDREIPNRADR